MEPLQGPYNRYARQFNGTFPGIGLGGKDGANPDTTTASATSSFSGVFNPSVASKDVTSTTNVPPTTSSSSSGTSTHSTSSSGQSFSNTIVLKTQTSVNAAIVATMTPPKTFSSTSATSNSAEHSSTTLEQSISTSTSVIVSVVTSPFSSATASSSDQPYTASTNRSSPGIIVAATLGSIVFLSCILAAILCCSRRRRKGASNTNESPGERPILALDTTTLRPSAVQSSPFTVTPYDYSSPISSIQQFSPFRRHDDGRTRSEATMTEAPLPAFGVEQRNKGSFGRQLVSARDTLFPVPRTSWSEHSATYSPQAVPWRDSQIPLLNTANHEAIPSEPRIRAFYAPANENAHFTCMASPASEKDSTDLLRNSGSFSIYARQETVSQPPYNLFGISRLLPDSTEIENDPPPAYNV